MIGASDRFISLLYIGFEQLSPSINWLQNSNKGIINKSSSAKPSAQTTYHHSK